MDNPFLRSLFVQAPVCAGRQLLPFSAYHAAALMLLDSPVLAGGGVAPPHLVEAIWVCSHDSLTGPAALFPAPPQDKLVELAVALDFEADWRVFESYMADYLEFAEVCHPDGEQAKTSAIPWPFYAVAVVLQHCHGISRREAWDMPLSELIGYKNAVAEANGAELKGEKQYQLEMLAACIEKNAPGWEGAPMTEREAEWWLRYQADRAKAQAEKGTSNA